MAPPAPTLAFIGCGNMGSAILSGLLDATRTSTSTSTSTSTTPPRFSRFVVSTKSVSSADRLRAQYATDADRVTTCAGENVRAMQEADVILLACKPFLAEEILGEPGVREAVSGKLVISILGGKTPGELGAYISASSNSSAGSGSGAGGAERGSGAPPVIARAMPNVAARLRMSMTIIEEVPGELAGGFMGTLTWVFEQIGKVKYVAPGVFDAGTMLVGASMAMMAVPLDGILDGCVVEGMRRGEAMEMMAQVMEGMAGLLLDGVHPALLRESISSPRGCTIQGILAVEKEGVRGTFAEGMIKGTEHLRK